MKSNHIFLAAILIVLPLCHHLWALPTTADDAEKVVAGWLKADPQPLNMTLGKQVTSVETFTNDEGEPVYHIVDLHPSGFVIVAADDQVEPIIAFANDGAYDPTVGSPLGALATHDVNGRIAAVRYPKIPWVAIPQTVDKRAKKKWDGLIGLAKASDDDIQLMDMPAISDGHPSDLRVAPLLKSLWGQECCYGPEGELLACYNYYMPNFAGWSVEGDAKNYPCGCVATTMAQLMHFHRHPEAPVEPATFTVIVDGRQIDRSLLGGEGPDGAYHWDDMVDGPGSNTTDRQRRAIGALCHDAGVSVGMEYTHEGSGAFLYDAATAFVDTFQYNKAVWGENGGNTTWHQDLVEMINPNLDADLPVLLGFRDSERPWRGHTAVCDGYGYHMWTPYYHLNMGWDGEENCWYNLPDINCPTAVGYDVITRCIYNIFPEGEGEIISGRIIDSEGEPLRGVTVSAASESGTEVHTTVTGSRGIYAFKGLSPNATYFVTASRSGFDFEINAGYRSDPSRVVTGLSLSGNTSAGNRWGVNFVGYSNAGGESQVICRDVKLTASDGESDDHFGCSVAIDGDYAVVGAYGNKGKRGAAYIFKREGTDWIQQAKVRAPVMQRERNGYFGYSVAISGDYAVIGSGSVDGGYRGERIGTFAAYIFKREGADWVYDTELGYSYEDCFGCSVAISGDYAIAGAPSEDFDTSQAKKGYAWGAAHVFKRSGTNWTRQAKLLHEGAFERNYFGATVSISGDYAIAAMQPHKSRALVYPVCIFERGDTDWSQQALQSSWNHAFISSLAITHEYAVIGASEDIDDGVSTGAAYVFERGEGSWMAQEKLTALDGCGDDQFGYSVSIDADCLVVGAPKDDVDYAGINSGSAYIFKRRAASWTLQAKLTALDSAYNDYFGHSVSIDGDYVIVGAPENDSNGKDSGSAYIFKRIGTTWSP